MRPLLVLVLVLVLTVGTAVASPHVNGTACDLAGLPAQAGDDAVQIDTSAEHDEVVATITIDGHEREVRAASCAELRESVALITSMALSARERPRLELTASGIRTSAEVETPSAHDLIVSGLGAWSSHRWQQAFLLGARWRDGDRSLDIELRLQAPESQAISAVAAVDAWTAAASASPCLRRGALAGCALVTLGMIEGSGSGLADTRRVFTPLVAAGLRLAWEHALSARFALRLQLDAEAELTSTRLDVDHMTVWTSDRVTIWGGAGLITHFP